MRAMSSAERSRRVRSSMWPRLRASTKRVSSRWSWAGTKACPYRRTGIARQEPEAGGDLGGAEELAGEGDDAVDQAGLDDVLADLAFAGLAGRHGAVGEDEAGAAAGRQVVQEVLDPGEVGVAPGRVAVAPALVALQSARRPSRRR